MRMPGFTGEATLYLTSGQYQMVAGEKRSATWVRPQQRLGQVVPFAGNGGDGCQFECACDETAFCCCVFPNCQILCGPGVIV